MCRILSVLACVLFTATLNAAPFPLAKDGKALAVIRISDKGSESTTRAAKELATYLQRVTGAVFSIEPGNGDGIIVGTLEEFPNTALVEPLKIRNTFDGKEAYSIRTEPKRLLLIGATDQGVNHAVSRLLEQIGCRWFFPAKEWESIPSQRDLSVELNVDDRPTLLSRRIWYGYGFFDRAQKKTLEDYESWARHNRMASSLRIHAGHAYQAIIGNNKKLFGEHPEYLALVKGQRQGEQICLSNPAVRELAVKHGLEGLRKNPQADMVSMETADGRGQCECEACKKLGSISDRAFGLANEVARSVAREFPGKMVGMLAYSEHSEPPSFALEPNVYVQLTAGFTYGQYSFDELKRLWPQKAKNLGFYEYLSVWLWDFDMPPGGRGANFQLMRDRIQDYVKHGASSLDCESGNNWGPHGLGYYVINKLMWNPNADVDAIQNDFFQRAFGPAEKPMRRYYGRLNPAGDPLLSEHLLALALRDLREATELAKANPEVLARIEQLKQYQHFVRLKWDFDRAKDLNRKKELALEALTFCHRTRYSYMNHWMAMQSGWSTKLAKDLGETNWANPKTAPWKNDTPVSQTETEKLFQEDLARFVPQEFDERTFSRDLVPAGLTSAKPIASVQGYQSPGQYAFFSLKGEPLVFTITTGIIAGYRDRAKATVTIKDKDGAVVHSERLPLDGEEHPLSIKVARPGLYWLDFHDSGAAWRIKADTTQPNTFSLAGNPRINGIGQQPRMYFFVPKGTKFVDYFCDGLAHDVLGPDGKSLAKVDVRGKFVRVAVPEGADGQAWSLSRYSLGKLRFMSVPNYLAASPEVLLTPREALGK